MKTKRIDLTSLIFMALCCDMGIVCKKIISPGANLITEYLHIPGGIGTSFSLMFIIIGAFMCDFFGAATLMCFVQSILAFILGSVGSMGMLVFIAYLVPGFVIDVSILILKHFSLEKKVTAIALTGAAAGFFAAFCANILTFRLFGPPLWLYFAVASTTGVLTGSLSAGLIERLSPLKNGIKRSIADNER